MAKFVHLSQDEKDYIYKHATDMSCVQMADWIGCTPKTVAYHINKENLRHRNIKWTQDNIDKLKLHLKDGCSCKQLASIFGTSIENLYVVVRRLKINGLIQGRVWKSKNEKIHIKS